jgi:hypothetical protein
VAISWRARALSQPVKMTRLSCHRFRSNEVRLLLSVIAYNLGNLWRRLVLPKRIGHWSLTSLQQRMEMQGLLESWAFRLWRSTSSLGSSLFFTQGRRSGRTSCIHRRGCGERGCYQHAERPLRACDDLSTRRTH